MSKRIRRLRAGEAIPEGTPLRYRTSDGYWCLRWRLGPGEYVEVLEHRLVAGVRAGDPPVHHRNHDKADNRPANLETLDPAHHARLHHERLPLVKAIAMYEAGLGTTRIAARLGCDPSAVWRLLHRNGVPTRPHGTQRREVWKIEGGTTVPREGGAA